MGELTYLYAAYSVIWGLSFAYLAYLHTRQARLERDLDVVRERLEERRRRKK